MSEHCKACGYRHLHAAWCNTRSKEDSGMSERQEILSKLERVWDLNPDKSFAETICMVVDNEFDAESVDLYVEDGWILERLDEIIDEHENGECR